MTKREIKKRIDKLKKVINYHRYLYHVLNRQEISDAALDSLKHELWELEQQYPEFITPDSPTQRVGGQALKEFKKIRHSQPILSIEDVFEFQELKDWQKYIKNLLPRDVKLDYFCERKIDGIDIVLTYKKGILINGATRGDGLVGEDVTNNIKTIEAIPLSLRKKVDLVVRGEIFMSKIEFAKLNKQRIEKNLTPFANPRNITAGSIRQLDPKVTAARHLDCFAFNILTDLGQKTHQQVHQILRELGFKTDQEAKYAANLEEVEKYHRHWYKERDKASFEYDGVVVVLNNVALEKQLGSAGKSPRWMRAYKFPAVQATTVIKKIILNVGRTGVLTPVAVLRPVKLMGSVISRATLHNADEIKRLGVREGDTVIIAKAGDVIPKVVKVLKDLRPKKTIVWQMPQKCPFCGSYLVRHKGEVDYYCPNKNCFSVRQKKIKHFISKAGFDIAGFGEQTVAQLTEAGLIKNPVDIFSLKEGDLLPLERFAQKSASKLVQAINESKKIILPSLINALSIRHVGAETSRVISLELQKKRKIKSIKDLIKAARSFKISDWQEIQGIGPKVGKSIYIWFEDESNLDLLRDLANQGIEIKRIITESAKLKGKSFVLTGRLRKLTRDQARKKIIAKGGEVKETMGRSADYLVLGDEPGEKLIKAKELGVKIIKEKEFLNLIK
ncbi:NAD-dependent DNA ligase LigA [candidate division WOR-3 bacterium]|nr:NAD-dependent DNA ligase LigA [candidate division WOR-3 bacterium]